MTSLRSLYLRVLVLGDGAPVGGFPFSEITPSSRSCCLIILLPEYSDRWLIPASSFDGGFFDLKVLISSSVWHQSHIFVGSDDSL